ncbi:MAG: hypothetical protein AAF690_18495 [Acidobacteriota bacterium]
MQRRAWLRVGLGLVGVMGLGFASFAALLFLYPRPEDTTAPSVFSGDGAALDYCSLPELDGSGLRADDIPKAFTPGCGWETWPMPVLDDCTEPLAEGVQDLRGLWAGMAGDRFHVERIEQCGNRTVVTTAGIIHDFVTDGSLANGSRDVEPPRCMNTWVAIEWRDEVLAFRPFGLPFVVVTRELRDDQLVWNYPRMGEAVLDRLCFVPDEAQSSSFGRGSS